MAKKVMKSHTLSILDFLKYKIKNIIRKCLGELDIVAHICNPSYSGSRLGGSRLEARSGKS
jgi:hypothetical protein